MRDDFLYGLRSLRATPGPICAAVLTLALAIGINAAMVGLIDRALYSPPEHVSDPERLVSLAFVRGEGDRSVRMATTSYVTYATVRDGVSALSGASAFQRTRSTVALDGEQISVDAMLVSGSYF